MARLADWVSHHFSRPDKRYEKLTQDNKIATTEKETAVKYKTKDQKETEAALIGLKEDAEGTSKELAAVLEYSRVSLIAEKLPICSPPRRCLLMVID